MRKALSIAVLLAMADVLYHAARYGSSEVDWYRVVFVLLFGLLLSRGGLLLARLWSSLRGEAPGTNRY